MHRISEEKIQKILATLEVAYNGTKKDLEYFVNDYSKYIDKVIINNQIEENLIYISGKATLKTLENKFMQFSLDLYFQNMNGKYLNKNIDGNVMEIDDYLTLEAKNILLSQREITFDIEAPQSNNNGEK